MSNPVRQNSIHDNGEIGIDLNADGPSPNDPGDPDEFANLTQNFPVLTTAVATGGVATITGTLDTQPGTYVVDFYGNPTGPDAEGQTYLGSITVNVASGPTSFSAPNIPLAQPFVTATATDTALLNTSEFSPAIRAQFPVTITTQASPSVPVGGQIFDTATLAGDISTIGTVVFRVYGPNDATCAGTAGGLLGSRGRRPVRLPVALVHGQRRRHLPLRRRVPGTRASAGDDRLQRPG